MASLEAAPESGEVLDPPSRLGKIHVRNSENTGCNSLTLQGAL
jgi:hypothetical protein